MEHEDEFNILTSPHFFIVSVPCKSKMVPVTRDMGRNMKCMNLYVVYSTKKIIRNFTYKMIFSTRPQRTPRLTIVAKSMKQPFKRHDHGKRTKLLRRELSKKIERALDTCFNDPDSIECTIAWMEVDEMSSALYNHMQQKHDIQDIWCDDDPSHRECREYDL